MLYVWRCDLCGVEGRDGYPGAPPDGWVRANGSIAGHVRSRDHDYCPECAICVNLVELAETGDLLASPSSSTPKRSKRAKVEEEQGPSLLDDESPE